MVKLSFHHQFLSINTEHSGAVVSSPFDVRYKFGWYTFLALDFVLSQFSSVYHLISLFICSPF